MKRLTRSSTAAMLALASCASPQPELKVRAISASSHGDGIEASETQLALGNVALALEGFRKVLRGQPGSVRALTGIAHSYEQMGRSDLSRKWFETALAAAPGDPVLLGYFAAFLDRQGNTAEASSVRQEASAAAAAVQLATVVLPAPAADTAIDVGIAANVRKDARSPVADAADLPPRASPPAALAEPAPSASVTVALPSPKPARPVEMPKPSAPAVGTHAQAQASAGPRLERLSLGEVALVTRGEPVWRGHLVSRSAQSATFRWVEDRPVARLLNAARNEGLAARTRALLADRGWKRLEIGDAPAVRDDTLVLYPEFRRDTAARLARQFGFTRLKPFNGTEIVVLLGRDAAKLKALRPA